MNLKKVLLLSAILMGLAACGGSKSTDTPAVAASMSLVGTWGNATETATYKANGTFALSQAGCTYTGGTYSVTGNKLSVTAVPSTATPSGTVPAATCSTATVAGLSAYSFTYTIAGNSMTYVDAAGTTVVHQLLGKWSNTGAAGTEVYTFNADGSYAYTVTPTGQSACNYNGGSYTVNGETLTFVTTPASAITNIPLVCQLVDGNVAAAAGLVSTIKMTSATTLTATSGAGVAAVATNYTRI